MLIASFLMLSIIGCSIREDAGNIENQKILLCLEDVDWPTVCVDEDERKSSVDLLVQDTKKVSLDRLIFYSLSTDASAEGVNDEIYRRFIEAPYTVLTYLALMGDQTVYLNGIGDVSAAEVICKNIANADVMWYGATEDFENILFKFEENVSDMKIKRLISLLRMERENAIERNR